MLTTLDLVDPVAKGDGTLTASEVKDALDQVGWVRCNGHPRCWFGGYGVADENNSEEADLAPSQALLVFFEMGFYFSTLHSPCQRGTGSLPCRSSSTSSTSICISTQLFQKQIRQCFVSGTNSTFLAPNPPNQEL